MIQKGRYGRYLHLALGCFDFLLINIAFIVTVVLTPEFVYMRPRTVWLLANLAYVPAAYLLNFNQTARTVKIEQVIGGSLKLLLIHATVFILALHFLQIDTIPLRAYFEFYGIMVVLFPIWWTVSRLIIKRYRRHGRNFSRVAIIGTNPTALRLYDVISSDLGFGYQVAGFFDNNPAEGWNPEKPCGTLDDFQSQVEAGTIDEIFCTLPGVMGDDIARTIHIAEANVKQYYYVPQTPRYLNRNYDMFAIGSLPVMTLRHQPLSHLRNRALKRLFDIGVSATFLVFSPIIFLPVAVAIKLSSPGPVFFRQKRTGYRGREFYCYKFRTMKVNVDADKAQATEHDPRKTKIGDILRRTSVDELPQFFNVLIGNMSVVGPRPHMLAHTEQYSALIKKYMVRHYVKPGITGWAQINGFRGSTEELWKMEKRVECDVWYIENWSTLLDVKIIFRTVVNAIHGEKNAF